MEGLSIEEKARAYDKAIAHAKKLLKTIGNATLGNLVLKNEFKNMFPALEESEDERIRKALITYFSDEDESYDGIPYPNIRAWLEKQGEQKPIKEHNACEFCEDRYGCVNPCSMKLVEDQKPAWSEEDRDILFRTINNLKFLRDTISIDPKYAINIIDIEREITWLNSLRPQNKTYYWTENEIKFAISDFIRGAESYEKMVEKLRCLKPQTTWKPSGEQMLAINTAINVLGKGTINGKYLIKLQEQLKKLREK